jgi:hypothetical protein
MAQLISSINGRLMITKAGDRSDQAELVNVDNYLDATLRCISNLFSIDFGALGKPLL